MNPNPNCTWKLAVQFRTGLGSFCFHPLDVHGSRRLVRRYKTSMKADVWESSKRLWRPTSAVFWPKNWVADPHDHLLITEVVPNIICFKEYAEDPMGVLWFHHLQVPPGCYIQSHRVLSLFIHSPTWSCCFWLWGWRKVSRWEIILTQVSGMTENILILSPRWKIILTHNFVKSMWY